LLVWVFGSMPLVETLPVADWLPQIPRLLASFGKTSSLPLPSRMCDKSRAFR
jgi:hypothetical protein